MDSLVIAKGLSICLVISILFPSFEATILLQEVEILLGIKSSSNGEVACPLGEFHVLDVLGEFMNEKEAKSIIAPNGLDLLKLSRWLIS